MAQVKNFNPNKKEEVKVTPIKPKEVKITTPKSNVIIKPSSVKQTSSNTTIKNMSVPTTYTKATDTVKTEIPKVNTPTTKTDSGIKIIKPADSVIPNMGNKYYDTELPIIKEYESLPTYNAFDRLKNAIKGSVNKGWTDNTYARKQELYPQYKQAKIDYTSKLLNRGGITINDVKTARGDFDYSNQLSIEEFQKRMLEAQKKIEASGVTIDDLDNWWNETEGAKQYDKYLEDLSEDMPVISSLSDIIVKPIFSTANTAINADQYLSGNPIEQTIDTNELRNKITDDMSGVGSFAYNTAMSVGDMLWAKALGRGGVGGAALMGAEKADDTVASAVERGLNPNQIMGEAVASGLTTAITEKFSFGKMEEIANSPLTKVSAKEIFKRIIASAIPEGAQEMTEDIADNLADRLIAQDKSEKNLAINNYMSQGMTEKEAKTKAFWDSVSEIALDGLGGAISGGLFGGIGLANNYAQNGVQRNALPSNEATQNLNVELPTTQNNAQTIPSADLPTTQNVEQTLPSAELPKVNNRNDVMAEDYGLNGNLAEDEDFDLPELKATFSDGTLRDSLIANGDGTNVSQTALNTFTNTPFIADVEENTRLLNEMKLGGELDVDTKTEMQSLKESSKNLSNDYDGEVTRLENDEWTRGSVDTDEAMMIIETSLNNGDFSTARRFMQLLNTKVHNAAQKLQSLAKYTRTAAGTMAKADSVYTDIVDRYFKNSPNKEQSIDNAINKFVNGADINEATRSLGLSEEVRQRMVNDILKAKNPTEVKRIMKNYVATGQNGISENVLKQAYDLFDEAKQYGVNSRQRYDTEQKAYALLAKDFMPNATWVQKWNAWRYMAMLGNTRTHIRNMIGNAVFGTVTNCKDAVASGLETLLGTDRTKSVVSKFNKADNAIIKAAKNDAKTENYARVFEPNKYNERAEIEQYQQVFGKTDKNILEKFRKFNDWALNAEDNFAILNKYSRALAGYLKANGLNESAFTSSDPNVQAILEKGRTYAIEQAKIATFHEANKFADALNNFERNTGKVGQYIIEGIVPFKKTPANILKQGVQYSPISVAKGTYDILTNVKRGKMNASEAVDTLSKGLTGSAIMALGYWLASSGVLSGGEDKDDKQKWFDNQVGKQSYALNIGDKSYTIDWAAPAALPLFVGAELSSMFNGEDAEDTDTFNKIMTAISTIANPIVETSMLQGVNDTLEALANGGIDDAISALAINSGTSYLTQGIPTLSGQIARAIDPTRRSTYTDEVGLKGQLDKTVKKVENKIPYLSMINEPYIDMWGNQQTNEGFGDNTLGRLAYNMFSPGYYDTINPTPLETELQRLADNAEIGTDVLKTPNLNKIGGYNDDKKLSPSDYRKLNENFGKLREELSNAVINSESYQNMTDEERKTAIDTAYDTALKVAKKGIYAEFNDSGKAVEAYNEGGVDGFIDYVNGKTEENKVEAKIEESGAKVNKATKTLVESGNDEMLPIYAELQNNFTNDYGKLDTAKSLDYLNSNNIPKVESGELFYTINGGADGGKQMNRAYESYGYEGVYDYYYFKSNGDTNGNGTLTKEELTNIMKALKYSDSEIENYWNKVFKTQK